MRARTLAASAEARPLPDEGADGWPTAEEPATDRSVDAGPIPDLCIECGARGCRDHGEIARLEAPPVAVHDAVARLQRTAAEHRAAARALRALVLSEVARGRGDLETKLSTMGAPPGEPPAQAEPCPRCALRDAEAAAAPAGGTKARARKAKGENGQQELPFRAP
jgi:hypothetical protein